MYLAIQTDSTRLMTYTVGDSSHASAARRLDELPRPVASRTGPEKPKQLGIVESEHVKAFGDFSPSPERSPKRTNRICSTARWCCWDLTCTAEAIITVTFRSSSPEAASKHGQHIARDPDNNTPLANLYVTMLQRLGLEVDRFGSSTGTLRELELKRENAAPR